MTLSTVGVGIWPDGQTESGVDDAGTLEGVQIVVLITVVSVRAGTVEAATVVPDSVLAGIVEAGTSVVTVTTVGVGVSPEGQIDCGGEIVCGEVDCGVVDSGILDSRALAGVQIVVLTRVIVVCGDTTEGLIVCPDSILPGMVEAGTTVVTVSTVGVGISPDGHTEGAGTVDCGELECGTADSGALDCGELETGAPVGVQIVVLTSVVVVCEAKTEGLSVCPDTVLAGTVEPDTTVVTVSTVGVGI